MLKSTNNKVSIYYLYLVLFFLLQNNFILTNKLAINLGEGIGSYRAKILVCFILIGTLLSIIKIVNNKNIILTKSISRIDILVYFTFSLLIIIRLIIDFSLYNSIDFIGVSPLVECLSFSFFFFLFTDASIHISKKSLNFIYFLIFVNVLFEIAFYFKDTLSAIQYGPFRANISGFVINRNPSFFYPIFCFVILKFANLKSSLKILYSTIFIIYIFTLFYRTIYMALIIPFIFDWILFNSKISLKKVLNFFLLLCIITFLILIFDSYFKSNYNFSFIEIFSGRFTSTFNSVDIDSTDARNQRVDQVPEMLFTILKNPLGIGFNGLVLDAEIYNYAFYFLHPILYLGWIVVFLYYYLGYILYKNFDKSSLQYRINFHFILYFMFVLILFPYMTYFTFTSIFIITFQVLKKKIIIE